MFLALTRSTKHLIHKNHFCTVLSSNLAYAQYFGTMSLPTYSLEDSQLVTELRNLSNTKGKLVKSSTYPAPADPSITVRSWKMDEYKYYDIPSPFPTLARGLFTVELPNHEAPKYRIVVRGYDKFFNIDEVPWTSVRYEII